MIHYTFIKNMKIKKILISFLLSASLIFAQSLSLENAISIALKNNQRINQYKERVAQKKFDDLSALGNFLPKIDLTGSYTHLNDDLSLNLNPIRSAIISMQANTQTEIANINSIVATGSPLSDEMRNSINQQFRSQLGELFPDLNITFKDQNYLTGTFQVVQPLFLGGKLIAGKKYSSAELKAAEYEFKKIENEVITEVFNNYLNVLLLQEVVKTREEVLAGMRKHLEQANRLLTEGVIANHQALRAEVAVAQAEVNLSEDKNKLNLAWLALENSLGIDENNFNNLSDPLLPIEVYEDESIFVSKAMKKQPVLKMLDYKKQAAEQKYNSARASFLPHLAAFGKYEIYPEYLSAIEPRWAIGLQLKLNIFNGLKDYMELQSAQHLEKEIDFIRTDMQRKINLWIHKSLSELHNSIDRYKKLESSLKLAKESLRLNKKRFDTGVGTSLEVIDAQLSYENIELKRLISLKNIYQSLSDLYLAAGQPWEILNVWNKTELQ